MRKYQQLLLLAVSVLSIVTLLLYRSENGRLKYVLDVVNMLGQPNGDYDASTAAAADLSFEFTTPLPIWQRIGKGFHAYAAFWHWDARDSGIGEVTAIVVGLQHAIVRFRCDVRPTPAVEGIGSLQQPTVVVGRFGFNRVEMPATELDNAIHAAGVGGDAFVVYKFICRVTNMPHERAPKSVTFAELTGDGAANMHKHSMSVRDLTATRAVEYHHGMVACVNMISPLPGAVHRYFYGGDADANARLREFFYHHQLVGVDEYIVYDNNDRMGVKVKRALAVHGIRMNYLPFNFPFASDASTPNDPKVRQILQLDCELRTLNISRWFMMVQPNEVLYGSDSMQSKQNSTLQWLAEMTTKGGELGEKRVQLQTNTVCLNVTATTGQMLIGDNLYVAESKDVVRSSAGPNEGNVMMSQPTLNRAADDAAAVLFQVPAERVLANRFVECRPMDRNTEVTHNTWPATIGAPAARKVMENLAKMRLDVDFMLES